MTLILRDYELSADAYKVRLLIALLGLPCRVVPVDVHPGREIDGPAFRRLNPRATVPVLQDGDVTLVSPEAILLHLARWHDPARTWLPQDPAGLAAVDDWLSLAGHELKAAEEARLHAMLQATPSLVDPGKSALNAYEVLEAGLVRRSFAGQAYLCGPGPTVADIAVFPGVALSNDFGCALEDFPKLRLWTRRIRALDGFVAMPGIPEFL